MAVPRGYRPLAGSERPQIPGSKMERALPASERVAFTILLRQRPGSPDLHDLEHWRKTPVSDRKFLSVDEFIAVHGGSGEDLEAVAEFFKSKGMRVLESDAGRRRLVVEGTASTVNTALGITLNEYKAPHRFAQRPLPKGKGKQHDTAPAAIPEHVHRGFAGPIHLPPPLADIVRAIVGLDDRRVGGPTGTGQGDPPGATSMLPTAVAQRYNFPNTGATGQTIGLFAAADEGAAYLPSDVTQFISPANLPAGYNTPPVVTAIGLTVGATTYGNVTGPITSGTAPSAAYETTQDVQTSAATGQGANINVYFTSDSEAGWEAFFQRAIFPIAGDNQPSVISASWVLYLDDGVASIGDPTSSGSFSNIVSTYLQSAATRGISALIAIGDWGADNQVTDGLCHVGYPNSDPWFTACGGTVLGTSAEWAWSDANTSTGLDLGVYDATGGGVSATFPVPSYQSAVGVLPISKNDGASRRGVPDVAGMVGMTGLVMNGGNYNFTGTSCVAPLYAGLVATINAFLGHSVGFLNPTLYEFGPEICNDITVGNNDSGPPIPPDPSGTTESPFYQTGIGWDPCTGWGSIHGARLLAALAPAPIVVSAIADSGEFGDACVGSFVDEMLIIDNSGFSELLISGISISPASDFRLPSVLSYPIAVSPGGSIEIPIRFQPASATPSSKSATISIASNDLSSPQTVDVSGTAVTPRISVAIADHGNFGNACLGSFVDEPLVINNSGQCTLRITAIHSSSAAFVVPLIVHPPIAVAPGASISLPIRFQPTALGPTPLGTTITVDSNDPGGPVSVTVSGDAPAGKLAVTGSTFFGAVRACCREERQLAICNTGDCKLQIKSVAFKRKSRHWKLINNPFPAALHPGSCLAVTIVYKATERFPRPCELVIVSDDPDTPVKTMDLLAATIWDDCGCSKCCDDCGKGKCDKRHCDPCCRDKCGDEFEDERDGDDED
jgi:pro-kumamolisin-like protein